MKLVKRMEEAKVNTVMERIIKEERAEVTIKAICNMIKYGVPKKRSWQIIPSMILTQH